MLVEFIYSQRFVTADQLRRRFDDRLTSQRTAQRHTARLVASGHLATAPVRGCGPHFPAVFVATGRGVRLVRETYAGFGRPWEGETPAEERRARGVALDAVLHELLVTEVALEVERSVAARGDLVLLDFERRYYRRDRRLTYHGGGEERHIEPDLGFLAAQTSGASGRPLPQYLVELETGTHTAAAVRRKLAAYAAWADAGTPGLLSRRNARNVPTPERPDFRLLLIAHDRYGVKGDDRLLHDLFAAAMELPRSVRDRVWLATGEELRRHQHDASPLDAAVWLRARDARRHLRAYGDLSRSAQRPGRGERRRRAFWAARLPTLPRRPLFRAAVTAPETIDMLDGEPTNRGLRAAIP